MIYDGSNAQGSKVYEMNDGIPTEIPFIACVDMDFHQVVQIDQPVRIENGVTASHTMRYEFISVIHEQGTQHTFRCYGKR